MPFSTTRFARNPPDPANPPSNVVDIAATAPTPGAFFADYTVYNVVRDADIVTPDFQAIFGPLNVAFARHSPDKSHIQMISASTL